MISRIERLRVRNNTLWIGVVRLALTHARNDARKLFSKIEENDRKIYLLTRKLAK